MICGVCTTEYMNSGMDYSNMPHHGPHGSLELYCFKYGSRYSIAKIMYSSVTYKFDPLKNS